MAKTVQDVSELQKNLVEVMKSEKFLKMQGLNQEVPFFVCPYSNKAKLDVEKMIPQLHGKLQNLGVNILEINLYDLCIELLQAQGCFEALLEMESEESKDLIMEGLQSSLSVEDVLMPAIESKIEEFQKEGKLDILWLTGIGEIFPYVRTHTILNNLPKSVMGFPTVVFFPGEYNQTENSGATLQLFGLMSGDRFYRAYDITKYSL